MKKKSNLSYYQERLGLQEASCSLIEHEDAIVAQVYRATRPCGTVQILKICNKVRHYQREVYCLNRLKGLLPVPHIVSLVPPEEGIDGALLMECLPGELLGTQEIVAPLAGSLGRTLALVHQNRFSGYGNPFEDQLVKSPALRLKVNFEEGLEECRRHLPSNLFERCRDFYSSQLPFLETIDGPCLVHRDFRPGNLMVHREQLTGVIDWAGARASFAEEDFCLIAHNAWLGKHLHTFLEGYRSIRPVPDYKQLIPLMRLDKAIGILGFLFKRGTWKNKYRSLYLQNREYLDAQFS